MDRLRRHVRAGRDSSCVWWHELANVILVGNTGVYVYADAGADTSASSIPDTATGVLDSRNAPGGHLSIHRRV